MDKIVEIDQKSGFCFGVKEAIKKAESALANGKGLYCLGDIVHNDEEVNRLQKLGMQTIDKAGFFTLKDVTVLIRAHGEPPEVYKHAAANNIQLIEGTCPVVLKLQEKIKKAYKEETKPQIVIFGKENHPEVIGLIGQTENTALVINSAEDCRQISISSDVHLFSQTTMNKAEYEKVISEIDNMVNENSGANLDVTRSICGQVANRGPWLEEFAARYDAIVFVGGKKSSNSKVLYGHCKKANPNSFFVSSVDELKETDLTNFEKIGICGATSTPVWLMEDVSASIKNSY